MTETPAVRRRITALEWVGVGAGVAALVASFLPWFVVRGTYADEQGKLGLRTWLTVWGTGFLGWFPVILLVAVAVALVLQAFTKPRQILPSLWLTLALVSLVMVLLRWITVPDATRLTGRGPEFATFHAGWGLYLGLVSALVSGLAAFLAFRSQQRRRPATSGFASG